MSAFAVAAVLGALATSVSAHGFVSNITVAGKNYGGYNPSYHYSNPAPSVAGWTANNQDNGFVEPSSYAQPDIICHKGATPGTSSVPVAAGSDVDLTWNTWPDSHHGPVITYLANCNGDCAKVDKTQLKFFKVAEDGLDTPGNPGSWATDKLLANGLKYTFTVPSSIAAGNYVARHEIIALHSAGSENGAQNYPQCINLQVTGGGSDNPAGVAGTALYKSTDPGIVVNIYQQNTQYAVPGPKLYSGAGSSTGGGSAAPAPSSAAPSSAASAPSSSPSASTSTGSGSTGSSQGSTGSSGTTKKACKKKRTTFKA